MISNKLPIKSGINSIFLLIKFTSLIIIIDYLFILGYKSTKQEISNINLNQTIYKLTTIKSNYKPKQLKYQIQFKYKISIVTREEYERIYENKGVLKQIFNMGRFP